MKVGEALDRLLSRLQPSSPVDAGLAEAGLMIDDPLEALVLRALALHGPRRPQGRTDLAAFVAASPRPANMASGLAAVGKAVRRLMKRKLIEGPEGGPYRLADRLAERVAHFPRLAGPEGDAPPLDLPAALRALEADPAPLTPEALAAALGAEPAAWAAALDRLDPAARALVDWVGPRVLRPPLRITLDHGLARLAALTEAALAATPDPVRGLGATWLSFAAALGPVLDPPLLAAQADRRAELLRRWAWFVGCPIAADGVEPPLISGAALVRLDWRRVQADARALEVMRQAEAAAEAVLDHERKRRAEAARAYASGRRE